ncbi:MAG: S-ribosylhomocysteine lyase [Lachnospiraceae bacterium]|nr:S-ribosylhomocysteine lyase [Lachnospiraceae bacterium]
MEKIPSFTVNHLDLLPGIYISRKDTVGNTVITTFDLRFTRPNTEPVMNTAEIHAIEHLGATFLRNSSFKDHIVYFGPMGCRTGFYLLLKGDFKPMDIGSLLKDMCGFIMDFEGPIPGASPRDCGNYLDLNLPMAKYYAKKYMTEVLQCLSEKNTVYPE